MAQSPQSAKAFVREVDDEVRRERMARLGRRYGIIAAVAVLVLLVVAGVALWWTSHREAERGARGQQFTAALSRLGGGDATGARRDLDALAATGTPGYAPLARMTLADALIHDGKPAQAAAAFAAIANDTGTAQPLRDLALVRATTLDFDRLPPAQVVARMRPLLGSGKPWSGSAGELTAIAQIKLGNPKAAGASFAAVARDDTVPQTLRDRARQMAGDLGVAVPPAAAAPRP